MKKIILLLVLVSFLFGDDKVPKVVIDLTTSSIVKFEKYILKSIVVHKNHYENSFKELEVAVVIHGGAYKFFLNNLENSIYKDDKELVKVYEDLKKRITTLSDTYDVKFYMCKVGKTRNKLQNKDILNFVKIIPTSTIGLIDRQNEGFAYISAGD